MQTRTKSGELPPPAPPGPEGPGPREAAAVWLVNNSPSDSDLLAYLTVELARQGDVLDRLAGLLPAAEAAAARLAHPIRGVLGRGPAAAVDMTGGKHR